MKPVTYTSIFTSREFIQDYKRANVRIRKFVDEALRRFAKNPTEWGLNNHPLREEWSGYRSIDVTADYRAIYKEVLEGKERTAYFIASACMMSSIADALAHIRTCIHSRIQTVKSPYR